VYAVLTKDPFPIGAYNKLKAWKIGPAEILKKINDNAYQLNLPDDVYTSDVFNVKHLIPYYEEEQFGKEDHLTSRTNSFQLEEDDAAQEKEREDYLNPQHHSHRSFIHSLSRPQSLGRMAPNDLTTYHPSPP